MNAIQTQSDKHELAETGLAINGKITLAEWNELGRSLGYMSKGLPWWIGDWVNYGVKHFGDTHSIADRSEQFGQQQELFSDFLSVAESVTVRHVRLKWGHHREVKDLPPREQIAWLKEAEEKQWTISDLRLAIRSSSKIYHDKEPGPVSPLNIVRLALDVNRWLKHQPPPREWPQAQRDGFKRDWEAIVEVWHSL